MAEAVSRRPLTSDVGFIHWPVRIGFVVDKVVRAQALVLEPRYFPVSTIQPVLHALYLPPILS